MKRIRVVRLLPLLDFGGVESRTVTLGKLIDRSEFDYQVCVLGPKGQAAAALEKLGVEVTALDAPSDPRHLGTYVALARYLRKTRPDVLHSSIADANIRAATAKLALPGLKVIIEEVGVDPDRALRARLVLGLAARTADLVIGVSRQTCDELIERHYVPREKVLFVNNSMDSRYLEIPLRSSKEGSLRCVAVGRLVPEKNHRTLVQAFVEVHKAVPQASLDIVGEGPLRQALTEQIEQLKLNEVVRLVGKRTDIDSFLSAADVFLMPSTTEGTSIALSEAMASACPIVGSNVPGIVAALQNYGAEWLLPPEDSRTWSDTLIRFSRLAEADRQGLGLRAREIVNRRMSPSRYVATLSDIYRKLVRN